jgi:hypothetical protein
MKRKEKTRPFPTAERRTPDKRIRTRNGKRTGIVFLMTLHPHAQAVLDFRKAEGGPGPDASVQEMRAADLKAT